MMINVMVKTCLKQKIIKKSNLIHAMKNNVCPIASVPRRPNFSENRICLKIYRMFRIVDWTHDMLIVKWREVTVIQFSESRICPKIYRMFRSVDWTHDMIIVKWHLFIWQRAQTLRSDKCATGSIHKWVNDYQRYSMLGAQVYVLYPRQFSSKLQATIIFAGITIHRELGRIFWKTFCVSGDDKYHCENMS